MCSMETSPGPRPPTRLSIKLPVDVAKLLHRLAYETGQSKRDLVIAAISKAYGVDALLEGMFPTGPVCAMRRASVE
jgi:hypothetical protein